MTSSESLHLVNLAAQLLGWLGASSGGCRSPSSIFFVRLGRQQVDLFFFRCLGCSSPGSTFWLLHIIWLRLFLQLRCRIWQDKRRRSQGFTDTVQSDGTINPGEWQQQIRNSRLQSIKGIGSNTHARNAAVVRENFKNYFLGTGAVPWQWNLME